MTAEKSCQLRVSQAYCAADSGTTESLPIRIKGDLAKRLLALISSRETDFGSEVPARISTFGFLGSEASTETAVAVPMADFRFPVS